MAIFTDDGGLTRRGFLQGAGAGALGLMAAGCRPAAARQGGIVSSPAPRPPNIVFILADDLGYGDLGCYGQARIKTPHLDRLAAEGTRFTQAYAGSTVCAPSRCALMLGQHTGHCRVRGNARVPLRPEDVTVAEVLKSAGYATGIVGKWGLGEPDTSGVPTRQGFDYWFGYLNQHHAHNYWPTYLWRNEERVALKNVVPNEDAQGGGVASERIEYSPDLFQKEALEFIRRHKDRPFFLYYATTIPHANNEAGKQGMEIPSDAPYSGEDWPPQEKNFAAMVTRLDRDVGELMALLKDLGLDGDTLVLFSSDNGPHREGGHDPTFFASSGAVRGIKRDLYDGGIRVPMIARRPGHVPAGAVSDHVWAFWDLLPTAAELAGVACPDGLDGRSVVPALLGRPQPAAEFLYWEFHERVFTQAVRMGQWKAVRKGLARKLELYDLRRDLREERDVSADEPAIVQRIEAYLKTARTDSADFPIRPPPKA